MSLAIQELKQVPLEMGNEGVVLLRGTRVTLDTVVEAFQQGATPEEINQQYTSLSMGAIYSVLGYYLNHQDEVGAYLAERARQCDAVRRKNELAFPPDGIRDRLLKRAQR
jgi:uncharacterized protein (DUF433 family)